MLDGIPLRVHARLLVGGIVGGINPFLLPWDKQTVTGANYAEIPTLVTSGCYKRVGLTGVIRLDTKHQNCFELF